MAPEEHAPSDEPGEHEPGPLATDADNPWAEAAGEPPQAPERQGPRVDAPDGSWDAAALLPPEKPKPIAPPRHRDMDLRLVERIRRAFHIPDAEDILDCLDSGIVHQDRLRGRRALVLTTRRVHRVRAGRAQERARSVLDVAHVTGAGYRRAVSPTVLAVGSALAGGVAGAASRLPQVWALDTGMLGAVGAVFLLLTGAATVLAALRREVWVDAGPARVAMRFRGGRPDRLQEFVDGVMDQKDRAARQED